METIYHDLAKESREPRKVRKKMPRFPRLEIPPFHNTTPQHPPPDPWVYGKNPGPADYEPRYGTVQRFLQTPAWSQTPLRQWREAPHPVDSDRPATVGSLVWHGPRAQRLLPPEPGLPLGCRIKLLDPREVEALPLEPFFRSQVKPVPLPSVHGLVQGNRSMEGAPLSHYRKTLQVVGELRTTRRKRVPTPQLKTGDDGTYAKYHPALMLPDPALVSHARLRAGSRYSDFNFQGPSTTVESSAFTPSESPMSSRPTTSC